MLLQYNLDKPRDISIEDPEEESEESESEEEEEVEEVLDPEKQKEQEFLEILSKKMAILFSSVIGGLFTLYLLTSYIHLKYASHSSLIPPHSFSVACSYIS